MDWATFTDYGLHVAAVDHETVGVRATWAAQTAQIYVPHSVLSAASTGAELVNAVFSESVGTLWRAALSPSTAAGGRVDVRLSVNGTGLEQQPWELMYDSAADLRLSASDRTTLVRVVSSPLGRRPMILTGAVRVLAVGAEQLDEAVAPLVSGGRLSLLHVTATDVPVRLRQFLARGGARPPSRWHRPRRTTLGRGPLCPAGRRPPRDRPIGRRPGAVWVLCCPHDPERPEERRGDDVLQDLLPRAVSTRTDQRRHEPGPGRGPVEPSRRAGSPRPVDEPPPDGAVRRPATDRSGTDHVTADRIDTNRPKCDAAAGARHAGSAADVLHSAAAGPRGAAPAHCFGTWWFDLALDAGGRGRVAVGFEEPPEPDRAPQAHRAGRTDRRRTAYPRIDIEARRTGRRDVVLVDEPFDIVVGLGRFQDVTLTQTGALRIAGASRTDLELVLTFDPTSLVAHGPTRLSLSVTDADPFPSQQVRFTARYGRTCLGSDGSASTTCVTGRSSASPGVRSSSSSTRPTSPAPRSRRPSRTRRWTSSHLSATTSPTWSSPSARPTDPRPGSSCGRLRPVDRGRGA